MKKLMITATLFLFSSTLVASGMPVIDKDVGEQLSNKILKAFCIDQEGYPALNREGFAWSYLGSSVDIRVDEDGKPIRCMTEKEYEEFFNEPFDPQFSYFEEK